MGRSFLPGMPSFADFLQSHTVYLLLVASGLALFLSFVWLMVSFTGGEGIQGY